MNVSAVEIIKQLMRNGMMVNVNQIIDFETAALVASDLGFQVMAPEAASSVSSPEGPLEQTETSNEALTSRPAIVTILGHVDHGKTTLLDFIRKSNVVAKEHGGITQNIGAYQINFKENQLTFLDTPGHEAFTAMRARGANVTDIVVLVVAADDGVMPQTREAINHVRAANVPVVVALSKIDRPDSDPERVKQQLLEFGLVPEEWGGDIIVVPTSGLQGTGVDDLLENLLVLAEIQELTTDPESPGQGVVVDSRLDKNQGPAATILVRDGIVRVGDHVVVGESSGRIKAMISEKGIRVMEAKASTPVEVFGLDSTPSAGDRFSVFPDGKSAKSIVEEKRRTREMANSSTSVLTLGQVSTRISTGETKDLFIILKCDVQGSIEAVRSTLDAIDKVGAQIRVIHSGVGTITEGDVLLASASKAIVIGFGTIVEPGARRLAQQSGVELRVYNIIYRLSEDLELARLGLMEPEELEIIESHAEVKEVIAIGRRLRIAGCVVTDGVLRRNAVVRVIREGENIHVGPISSLKRFQDDVREVLSGLECGLALDRFLDFQEGDVLESYRIERNR
jgi:translation initiation factor IF-2